MRITKNLDKKSKKDLKSTINKVHDKKAIKKLSISPSKLNITENTQ